MSLYGSRRPVPAYAGPRDMVAYARKLTRDATAEQARMDRMRAVQLRANIRKADAR